MRAVFISGGKQYRVRVGSVVAVEKIAAEAGAQVDFEQVLLICADGDANDAAAKGGDTAHGGTDAADNAAGGGAIAVGAPLIDGAKVRATVVAQERGPKLRIFKLRRRKNSRRSGGHRQSLTRIKVDEIVAPPGLASAANPAIAQSIAKPAAESAANQNPQSAAKPAAEPAADLEENKNGA